MIHTVPTDCSDLLRSDIYSFTRGMNIDFKEANAFY